MHSMDIRRKSPFTTPQLHCSKFSAHRNSILSLFPFCSLPGTSQIDLGCTLYKWMLCAGIQVKRRRRKEKRWQLLSCIKQLQGHNHASTVDLKFAQSIKVNKMKLFLKWKKKKVGQTVICCLEKQLKSRKMHFGGRNFRHPIILLCKRDFPAETSNTKAAQTTKPPRTAASAASLGTQTTRAGPTPHLSLEEWPFHGLPPGATCPQLSMLKGSMDFPAMVNSWIWWTSEIPERLSVFLPRRKSCLAFAITMPFRKLPEKWSSSIELLMFQHVGLAGMLSQHNTGMPSCNRAVLMVAQTATHRAAHSASSPGSTSMFIHGVDFRKSSVAIRESFHPSSIGSDLHNREKSHPYRFLRLWIFHQYFFYSSKHCSILQSCTLLC